MTSLLRLYVLTFSILLSLLAAVALRGDYLLHRLNLVWVGRSLGIPGAMLIIGSLSVLFASVNTSRQEIQNPR